MISWKIVREDPENKKDEKKKKGAKDVKKVRFEEWSLPLPPFPARVLFGRHRTSHIKCLDTCVSHHHCMLFLSEDGTDVYIQDLASTNGTFIDDVKLHPDIPYLLMENSVFSLASPAKECPKTSDFRFRLLRTPASSEKVETKINVKLTGDPFDPIIVENDEKYALERDIFDIIEMNLAALFSIDEGIFEKENENPVFDGHNAGNRKFEIYCDENCEVKNQIKAEKTNALRDIKSNEREERTHKNNSATKNEAPKIKPTIKIDLERVTAKKRAKERKKAKDKKELSKEERELRKQKLKMIAEKENLKENMMEKFTNQKQSPQFAKVTTRNRGMFLTEISQNTIPKKK